MLNKFKSLMIATLLMTNTLVLSTNANAHANSAEAAVLAVEQSRIKAMKDKNWSAIDAIMASDCIHITTDGSLRTKEQYMERMYAATARFTTFKTNDITVRVLDDIAITTGHYENSKLVDGVVKPVKHGVFTRIYQNRDNKWLLISHQATVDGAIK